VVTVIVVAMVLMIIERGDWVIMVVVGDGDKSIVFVVMWF
jgi:hypothetical protein